MKRERLKNYSLMAISTALSIVAGTVIYRHVVHPVKLVVYQGQGNDYAMSFYNTNGQRISGLTGNLKLRMHPFTIYDNYPNQNTSSYSINGEGFRNTYTNNPAPEKIAIVLGGSAAFGVGLQSDNDTFVSHAARLNQKYRFMNAGIAGFLSGQELSLMVHVLDRYNPSLYIAFDGWNDMFDPFQHAIRVSQWPMSGAPIGFNNAFFMIETKLAEAFQKEPSSNSASVVPAPSRTVFEDEQAYFQAIVSTYTANLEKMHSFASARKARYIVAFQPELGSKIARSYDERKILEQWNAALKYTDRSFSDKYRQLVRYAKSFCDQNGILYVDVNDDEMFAQNSKTLFYDAVHPNEEGHRIIAEIINKALTEKF